MTSDVSHPARARTLSSSPPIRSTTSTTRRASSPSSPTAAYSITPGCRICSPASNAPRTPNDFLLTELAFGRTHARVTASLQQHEHVDAGDDALLTQIRAGDTRAFE